MQRPTERLRMMALAGGLIVAASVAGPSLASLQAQATEQKAPKHHSKLKGAIVGGVVGKVAGGHTKAGAVAGAMVQHRRNKKVKKG